MLLGAVGLSALLASCGSGVAPDLSGSGRVTAVRTEYRLGNESGPFIACDNYNGATATTQVSVYFDVAGNVKTVDLALRGNTTTQYDENYKARFTREQLEAVGNGSYRATFTANPLNGLLPQSIVVGPARAKVKVVTASGRPSNTAGFYAALSVDTGTATYDFNSRSIPDGNVAVYTTCTFVRNTNEDV